MANPKAEILKCRYCGSHTVGMGGMAQCPKGCPGWFDVIGVVSVPLEGVKKLAQRA